MPTPDPVGHAISALQRRTPPSPHTARRVWLRAQWAHRLAADQRQAKRQARAEAVLQGATLLALVMVGWFLWPTLTAWVGQAQGLPALSPLTIALIALPLAALGRLVWTWR